MWVCKNCGHRNSNNRLYCRMCREKTKLKKEYVMKMKECKYNEIGDFCEHPKNDCGVCDDKECPLEKK